ncbi:MAG: chromate transporter [Lentisphaeria bacterium]|nr:chromate transporter [Lentisphaeria bacterium]
MLYRLWLLFFTFARIAALVLGGGLAMLPVIEETFVNKKKLLTAEELLDVVAITQTVPGIIAANAAVSIGMKIAGFAGALAALAGAVLPSFVIILIIAMLFPALSPDNVYYLGAFAGIRAGVTGLIAATALKIGKKTLTGRFEVIAAAILLAAALYGVNPGFIIVTAVVSGVIYCRICAWRVAKAGNGGGK